MKTKLCEIMTRHGSDKGSGRHNYTEFYHEKFQSLKDKELKIFELGLGTNNPNLPSSMGVDGKPGASLRGWKEYFPNSEIYGADIDKDIIFQEDRIKTFYCDQTNKEVIYNMWSLPELSDKQFDIIIDDGLHECYANMIFLENSIHKLKDDGIYIIEDVINYNIHTYTESLKTIKNTVNIFYEIIRLDNINNNLDNTIIVIKI
jgi:SAM-dependent methyltransferase